MIRKRQTTFRALTRQLPIGQSPFDSWALGILLRGSIAPRPAEVTPWPGANSPPPG